MTQPVHAQAPIESPKDYPVELPIPRHSREIYPLTVPSLLELGLFREKFTMLIPHEAQKKIFLSSTNEAGHRDEYFLAGLYSKDRAHNISRLIEERDRFWTVYFGTFTTVKEAPSDDTQVINYELILDLGTFCSYGRLTNDLLSK